MNKRNLIIWNREFKLDVCLQHYPGEDITENQKNALEKFMLAENLLDSVKKEVEEYILKNQVGNNRIDMVDNIFKYLMPQSLFVPRANERIVALFCNFKFDMEHGVAIVFENEKLKCIGTQDIVL